MYSVGVFQHLIAVVSLLLVMNDLCDLHADAKLDSDLTKKLPTEIWYSILRDAIILQWTPDKFLPPPDDMSLISGFSKTSTFCHRLAGSTPVESVAFKYEDEPGLYGKRQYIR